VCKCYPGFGDSIIFVPVTISAAASVLGAFIEQPVASNGSALPGCGFEGAPGCMPVYVGDCGSLMYVPAEAGRRAQPSLFLLFCALAGLLAAT